MDNRQAALLLARGRAVIGLAALTVPGLFNRLWLGGTKATSPAKAMTRAFGARELVLGIGTLTSVKEQTQGPEWLSMGAVADGVDAAVSLLVRGAPRRTRVIALVAAGSAVGAMKVARELADERAAASGSGLEARA
jgi:hypothetical protein